MAGYQSLSVDPAVAERLRRQRHVLSASSDANVTVSDLLAALLAVADAHPTALPKALDRKSNV